MKSPLQRQARWKELCLILAKKQKNRSSVTCFAPKGWGPQKSPLFWGKGGAGKRAIDFFKRKNRSSETCSDVAGIEGFEPSECWSQNPVPYRLAISQSFFFLGSFCVPVSQRRLLYHGLSWLSIPFFTFFQNNCPFLFGSIFQPPLRMTGEKPGILTASWYGEATQ